MGWNVCVTRELPDPALPLLRGACERVDVNPHDRVLSRDELLAAVAGRDGILATGQDRIDAELLDAAGPGLRAVANYAVGCDNIDRDLLTARGIPYSNTPDVLTDATADLAWALMLAAARRIAEADRYVRDSRWHGWGPTQLLGMDVAGRTLGIVGAGRIGQAAGRRATGFGMQILYWSRSPKPEFEAECGARRVELEELLQQSDFVSLHLPGTPETRHIIGERELGLMKPTAVLVNTGRGPLVDEAALVEALREHRIAAAGLDVFEEEPKVHPGLLDLDNVVLAPHIGSATHQARSRMAEVAATCLIEMLEGRRPPQCVNGEVFG
jgi:lactate dehydrogenase-like 2-hydroxyacid dehydrogenase